MENKASKNINNKPKSEPVKNTVQLLGSEQPKKQVNQPRMGVGLAEHFQITWRVATITLLSIVIFGGGGWMLDKWIGTFPLFMIIGMVISYPVAQILIYIVFKRRHNL